MDRDTIIATRLPRELATGPQRLQPHNIPTLTKSGGLGDTVL